MKRIWLLMLLATPALGQSDSARIAKLEAKVAYLDSIVGTRKFNSPQVLCSNNEAARPKTAFPNGEYDLAYRNRQFGCAFDPIALTAIRADQASVQNGLAIVALQSRVTALENGSGSVGNDSGTMYFTKLVLGQCKNKDSNSQIQICGLGDASIYFESNLNSLQFQNPSYHVGTYGLQGDGGMKAGQNCYTTIDSRPAYDSASGTTYQTQLKCAVDPTREYSFYGPDSRGRYNWQLTMPGFAHEYTQDLILNFEPYTKAIQWQSMQSLWHFENMTSNTTRGLENINIVPKQ